MDDAVTVLDAEGRIVMANAAAARLMGAGSVERRIATPTAEFWERFALYDPEGRPLSGDDLAWMRALGGSSRGCGYATTSRCSRSAVPGRRRCSRAARSGRRRSRCSS
jgi:PAS domain-containing protein